MNTYDGKSVRLYKPVDRENNLSGNLIDYMMEGGEDMFWIQTNYGLDCFDTRTQKVWSHKKPKGVKKMAQSKDKDTYMISDEGYIYCTKSGEQNFIKLNTPKINIENICQLTIDNANFLWIFSSHGQSRCYAIKKDRQHISLVPEKNFKDPGDVIS